MRAAPVEAQAAGAQARRDRWLGLPLLVLLASSGLPLSYQLALTRPLLVADVYDLTLAAASSSASFSSSANLVLMALLYGMAGLMLLARPRAAGAVLRQHWPLPALLLLLAASGLWSHHPAKVLLNAVHNTGVVLVALAAALHYRHQPWQLLRHIGLVLGANMALQVAAVLVAPDYAVDWQGRWQGLTVHPNTLGALALTTFWANAAVLVCCRPERRPGLHLLGCLLALAAMTGADSVTSKLTALAALLLLLAFQFFNRCGAGRRFYLGLLIIGLCGVAAFLLLAKTADLAWLFEMLGRDGNLTGRSHIWDDAYRAIALKPLLGWSFDDHAHLIASAGMPYSSYHSGLLDLAVNGGIAAVLLLALLMLTWARSLASSGRVASLLAPASAAFVLCFVLHNLTEASYVSPRGQMWVLFLTLVLAGACRRPPAPPPRLAPLAAA